jgi:hypothetical protein
MDMFLKVPEYYSNFCISLVVTGYTHQSVVDISFQVLEQKTPAVEKNADPENF